MTNRDRNIRAALNGPSGEALRLIAAQPNRASTSPTAKHAGDVLIPVARNPMKGVR